MLKSSAHKGLTGAAVRELASEARTRLRLGEGGYRRDHVRAFAQRVEVADDAIYIKGSKNVLLRNLVAAKGGKSAGIGVPGFIPKWRRRRDSNPRYRFRYTPLAGERLRPLGHLSARGFSMRHGLGLQGFFRLSGEDFTACPRMSGRGGGACESRVSGAFSRGFCGIYLASLRRPAVPPGRPNEAVRACLISRSG